MMIPHVMFRYSDRRQRPDWSPSPCTRLSRAQTTTAPPPPQRHIRRKLPQPPTRRTLWVPWFTNQYDDEGGCRSITHPASLAGRHGQAVLKGHLLLIAGRHFSRATSTERFEQEERTFHHAGLLSTRESPYSLTLGGSLTDFCSSSIPSRCQAPRLVLCASTQGYRSARASHGRLLRSCRMPGWAYPRPSADSGFTALLIGASKRTGKVSANTARQTTFMKGTTACPF